MVQVGKHILRRRLWMGVVAANLLLAALAGISLYRSHQRVVEQAWVNCGNLAQVLNESLGGFFARIDLTLLALKDEAEAQLAQGGLRHQAIHEFILRHDPRLPEALGLRMTNAQGQMIHAVHGVVNAGVNVSEQEHFRFLSTHPEAGLVLSKPYIGPTSGQWVLVFARRYNDPQGRFAGQIHVAVPIQYLIDRFSRLELGPKGSVTLWDRSPAIVARYSEQDKSGKSIGKGAPSQALQDLLAAAVPATTYRAFAGTDQTWRTYAFQRIGDSPLFLVVGLADEDLLAHWWRDLYGMCGSVLAFALFSLLGVGLLQRGLEQADRRIAETETTLRAINGCNEAIARSDTEPAMLQAICRLLVADMGRIRMAWVGRAVQDEEKTIELLAVDGAEADYIQEARLTWADCPQGNGPVGRALRLRQVCCMNVLLDVDFAPWRDMALRRGFRSVLALPMEYGQQMMGALVLYAGTADFFTLDRIDHLQRLVQTISHGIHSKRLREALQSSETLFRSMFEHSPLGMVLGDLDGYVVDANDAFLSMLGYQRSSLIHHDLSLITPAAYEAENDHVLHILMQNGRFGPQDMELRHCDGHLVTVRRTALLLHDPAGNRLVWSILENIAERAAAERSLSQKTAELMRSNAELEQFAYVASHDLREPLRLVSSYVSLMQRRLQGKLDGDIADYMDFVRQGVERMDRVILDLLDFSRTGRRDMHLTHIPLRQVVEHAMEQVAGLGTVDLPADLPVVEGVRQELERLFANLFHNCVKFGPVGQPLAIHVTVQPQDQYWRIGVHDNGIGIDPQYHDRIFRIFQRLHARQHYDGNGIGLAICKKIAELHGGRIWVESALGQGASFYFTLPTGGPPAG